jgi:2-polyprenyl-3-methyl-5-hydroxy-6-metoxy-1,4-benzoquinol methylase
MSYKHYFPTFRARWRFLDGALAELGPLGRVLHVGCGEGDHDAAIKRRCQALVACDLNAEDIAHARALHGDAPGLEFRVEDATALGEADGSFDAVICMEVIEHVGEPRRLLTEIARVLRPGGRAILTCPSVRFPVTYDPLNFALAAVGTHLPIGAYAFGHDWLVDEVALVGWLGEAGLAIERRTPLTGWLAAMTECYWIGAAQRVVKANAGNRHESRAAALRPGLEDAPLGVGLVDALVAADAALGGRRSVGLGFILRKA